MAETPIFFWTGQFEQTYAYLRKDHGHWRIEWGYRDPPGSDNFIQHGEHENSDTEDIIQVTLQQIRNLCTETDDFDRVEERLRKAMQEVEIPE